jgi:hypothetical protein
VAKTENAAENRARVGAHRQLSTPNAIKRRKRRTIVRNTWSRRLHRKLGEVRIERLNIDQLVDSARRNAVARSAAAKRLRDILKGRHK